MTTQNSRLTWLPFASLTSITVLCVGLVGWSLAASDGAAEKAAVVQHELSTHVAAQIEHEKHVMYRLEEIKNTLDRMERNGQ